MAFSLVNHGIAHSSDGNTATVTVDTRTANLFVITFSRYTAGATQIVLTDGLNNGNFIYKTEYSNSASGAVRLAYIINPTTNIADVFVGAGNGSFFSFIVEAYLCDAGTPIYDTEIGVGSGSAQNHIFTTSATPAQPNSLVVGGLSFYGNNNNPDAGSYTCAALTGGIQDQQIYTGNGLGAAMGYKASESSAINPDWSWLIGGVSGVANVAAAQIIFSPPAAGGPTVAQEMPAFDQTRSGQIIGQSWSKGYDASQANTWERLRRRNAHLRGAGVRLRSGEERTRALVERWKDVPPAYRLVGNGRASDLGHSAHA